MCCIEPTFDSGLGVQLRQLMCPQMPEGQIDGSNLSEQGFSPRGKVAGREAGLSSTDTACNGVHLKV